MKLFRIFTAKILISNICGILVYLPNLIIKRNQMAHITIKNIGPIKEVDIDLNKINIFMGPQSSGKSTIAKIICHCQWVEKQCFPAFENEKVLLKIVLIKFFEVLAYSFGLLIYFIFFMLFN